MPPPQSTVSTRVDSAFDPLRPVSQTASNVQLSAKADVDNVDLLVSYYR